MLHVCYVKGQFTSLDVNWPEEASCKNRSLSVVG